jgi:hypothetical protein
LPTVLCRYPRLRDSTNHTTAAMTAMTTMAMITFPISSLCTIASTLAHHTEAILARVVLMEHGQATEERFIAQTTAQLPVVDRNVQSE